MDKTKKADSYWHENTSNELWTGKGIGVAVLDTGAFPHIDFDNRIWSFQDFVNRRTKPYDDNGHGTHVKCGLIPIKVLDKKGNGSKEKVLRAFQWILENKDCYNIRIVNISVGTTRREGHEDLIRAVEDVWDAGLVVVAAAGNMGPGRCSITAPGSSRKIITVGSSDMLMKNHGISGRGPTKECISKPDIVAPGSEIMSCTNSDSLFPYIARSGTSMSTPIVSGGIALLLEKYPQMTNLEVKKKLWKTAKDLGYEHNLQGWGLFDLHKFLQ